MMEGNDLIHQLPASTEHVDHMHQNSGQVSTCSEDPLQEVRQHLTQNLSDNYFAKQSGLKNAAGESSAEKLGISEAEAHSLSAVSSSASSTVSSSSNTHPPSNSTKLSGTDFEPASCYGPYANTGVNIASALMCGLCGFPKASSDELEAHIAWDHLKWAPFQCPYCPNVFRPTMFTLRIHLREVHPDNQPKIICSINEEKSTFIKQKLQDAVLIQIGQRTLPMKEMPLAVNSGQRIVASSENYAGIKDSPGSASCKRGENSELLKALHPSEHIENQVNRHPGTARICTEETNINPKISHGSCCTAPCSNSASQHLTASVAQENSTSSADPCANYVPASIETGSAYLATGMRAESETKKSPHTIYCQRCLKIISSNSRVVLCHVYEHLRAEGYGARYICSVKECGFSSAKRGLVMDHCSITHGSQGGKGFQDHTVHLKKHFYKMGLLCFPGYVFDKQKTCKGCNIAVSDHLQTAHIYECHVPEKCVKCPHCPYSTPYRSSFLRDHMRRLHKGLSMEPIDIRPKYQSFVELCKHSFFGEDVVVPVAESAGFQFQVTESARSETLSELPEEGDVKPILEKL